MEALKTKARYDAMSEKELAKELKLLEKQMLGAAKNMEFEKAAEYRDKLKALKNLFFAGFVESKIK